MALTTVDHGGLAVTTELFYLACAATLTALLWVPYILDRFGTWGIADTFGYPKHPAAQSSWAVRLMKAHANAIENLAVFAALVLVAHETGVNSQGTALAAAAYFWARLVHVLAYAFAVPYVRTLAFLAGFGAQMVFAWQVLVA